MKGMTYMTEKKYDELKDLSDVVISTRIRFARNLEDYPFPCRLSGEKNSKWQIR